MMRGCLEFQRNLPEVQGNFFYVPGNFIDVLGDFLLLRFQESSLKFLGFPNVWEELLRPSLKFQEIFFKFRGA